MSALRKRADIVVASFHWGVFDEVLQYMTEIAHAAIDSGADIVIGHGPHHYVLPIEFYEGKPIFYGLGGLSFQTGHGGDYHGDWVGILAKATFSPNLDEASFRFIRQERNMEVIPRSVADEQATFEELQKRSASLGARLIASGDHVVARRA